MTDWSSGGRRLLPLALVLAVSACGAAGGADRAALDSVSQEAGAGSEASRYTLEGETVPIRVGGIEVMVEVADEEDERSRGLMFRESLPENQGMLFVYTDERPLGFWMRNTLIPLDIAYIDGQGRIVDIQQMEPRDETTRWSKADAMYALEMNQGWFERNGVGIGALVEF